MSKFSKALEQAQRDRALRTRPVPAPPENGSAPATENGQAAHNGQVAGPHPQPGFEPQAEPTAEPRFERRPAPRPAAAPPGPTAAPRRPSGPSGPVDDHLVSLLAPASLEAEQYRALRHRVEQRHKADGLTLIGISSPGGGDGKTTTAINLAGALAQDRNARVLLLEVDLRRPSIGALLGLGEVGSLGLVHAILDPGLRLADVVQSLPTYNLDVVLAGQTPPSPYEVLQSPRFAELLAEARRDYDYVVMDTAPLVPVQDCRVIARLMDGIVLVVAAHHTPRPMLEAALDIIDPAQMIGLVFNGYDHLLADRYHGGYYTPRPAPRGAAARGVSKLGRLLGRGAGRPRKGQRPRSRGR
jgi:capsular exopolysaccharide synthesis family protein